jgi:hypothetical protein
MSETKPPVLKAWCDVVVNEAESERTGWIVREPGKKHFSIDDIEVTEAEFSAALQRLTA